MIATEKTKHANAKFQGEKKLTNTIIHTPYMPVTKVNEPNGEQISQQDTN